MYKDPFSGFGDSPSAPAETCFAIIPNDVDELPSATKALYVGTGGDIALVPVRGSDPVTFVNVVSGSILDMRVRAVKATGTTAANIIGLA